MYASSCVTNERKKKKKALERDVFMVWTETLFDAPRSFFLAAKKDVVLKEKEKGREKKKKRGASLLNVYICDICMRV